MHSPFDDPTREHESRKAHINWRWIRGRLRRVLKCWHQWGPSMTNWPNQEKPPLRIQACQKCGVWRWWPVMGRLFR